MHENGINVLGLVSALEALDTKSNEEWIASLDERKKAELKFHDMNRRGELEESSDKEDANKKYYTTVVRSREYSHKWIQRNAAGKVFLDYACGNGENAILAAQAGAAFSIGLDISRTSVEIARKRAKAFGVKQRTFFVQGDCENTELPNSCVDVVLCYGVLHHLDLRCAFPELRRIMKPGGRCFALEALGYNPLIKLYRYLTPNLRTEWEKKHILSLKDLKFAKRFFKVENVRYWHLLSALTTPLRNTAVFFTTLNVANAIDSVMLRVPPISFLAWMFSFELVKPES